MSEQYLWLAFIAASTVALCFGALWIRWIALNVDLRQDIKSLERDIASLTYSKKWLGKQLDAKEKINQGLRAENQMDKAKITGLNVEIGELKRKSNKGKGNKGNKGKQNANSRS